jgi:hypothetical protein
MDSWKQVGLSQEVRSHFRGQYAKEVATKALVTPGSSVALCSRTDLDEAGQEVGVVVAIVMRYLDLVLILEGETLKPVAAALEDGLAGSAHWSDCDGDDNRRKQIKVPNPPEFQGHFPQLRLSMSELSQLANWCWSTLVHLLTGIPESALWKK